jgi:hypothetical protein
VPAPVEMDLAPRDQVEWLARHHYRAVCEQLAIMPAVQQLPPHAPATRLGSVDDRHHQTYRSAVTGPGQTRVFSVALATDRQNGELGEWGPRASH